MTRTFFRLLLPAVLLVGFALADTPVRAQAPQTTASVPGEVVVRLREGAIGAAPRLAGQSGAQMTRVSARGGFATLSVAPGREGEVLERLRDDPAVESAELNTIKQPLYIPVDEHFDRQWDMPMIQAPQAWNKTRGAGVTIAVVDTGVAYEDYAEFGRSPELSQTFFVYPFDATDGTEHANDENGHGTHVTGTLAQDWDAFGTAGLAPKAAIMPVRVCESFGCASDAMADGVYWAVDHGADVINVSLGGPFVSQVERDAFEYAEEHNVVVVAAGGNGGGDLVGDANLDYPSRIETVISVGAVNRLAERTVYSNWGEHEGADPGTHVMAPGGNTHQDLDQDGFDDGIRQNTYAFTCGSEERSYTAFAQCSYYGTSMATPHVSGVAALLLSLHPDLTAPEVRRVIGCATAALGDEEGFDEQTGWGLVQAAAAISDSDDNGIVDCLDLPPPFSVTIDAGKMRPGERMQLSLEAQTPWPGVSGYDVGVTFDPLVAKPAGCTPREGTTCDFGDDHVAVSGVLNQPLFGSFRLAYIEFEAVSTGNAFSSVHLFASGTSARVPDIGLSIATSDGSLRIAQPMPTLFGDLDCDKKVVAADAIAALRSSEGEEPFCGDQGDVDCSGAVGALDGLAIVAYLAGVTRPQVVDCPPIGISLAEEPTPLPG